MSISGESLIIFWLLIAGIIGTVVFLLSRARNARRGTHDGKENPPSHEGPTT